MADSILRVSGVYLRCLAILDRCVRGPNPLNLLSIFPRLTFSPFFSPVTHYHIHSAKDFVKSAKVLSPGKDAWAAPVIYKVLLLTWGGVKSPIVERNHHV